VPQDGYAHLVVGLPLGQQLGRLPVPDETLSVRVSRDQVAANVENNKQDIKEAMFPECKEDIERFYEEQNIEIH
jgi:hypothetical protein